MTLRAKPVISSLLTRRARALHRYLPLAIKGDYIGVHQARVASRRLREAVPVLAEGLREPKAARSARRIRRLTRVLGAVRELDVTLRLLDELSSSDELSRPALQDVRLHVMAEREQKREAMLARLAGVETGKLERRLRAMSDALDEDGSEAWRPVLAGRLLKRARRLADAVEEAGHLYVPDHLHRVRIAAKKLRYALELAADSGTAEAAPHVRTLKRTQETLGRLHDLQILQQHVAAVQAAPAGRTAPHEGLGAIAGRIEEECRRLHGRYVAHLEELRALTAAVRGGIVPRLTHPRRPPLKMALPRPPSVAARNRNPVASAFRRKGTKG